MLDADQTRVSPDAVAVTSRAAELFLEALAAKAHAEATAAARTTIAFRDVGKMPFAKPALALYSLLIETLLACE
jgi:histone H3/H4